jgi:hypothetical protein
MRGTAEQLPIGEAQGQLVDQRLRHKNDTITWAAEMLNGSMRSTFEYTLVDDELYGEDGGALSEIFDESIIDAEVTARKKPNLLFELRRRLIERGELNDIVSMAKGKAPNTMVVLSDFPEELMNSTKDVGGYNVTRKQTMMRVIARQRDGSIRMTSQSLDGSNREALEGIYQAFGTKPREGELLEQRIYADLASRQQDQLVDSLRGIYDNSLTKQRGGSWHAGIATANGRKVEDTYEFAKKQGDLVDWFVSEKVADSAKAESLRFSFAATMSARYERDVENLPSSSQQEQYTYVQSTGGAHRVPQTLAAEMQTATLDAMYAGKTFSGCGTSAKADAGLSLAEQQLRELGFGNLTTGDEDDEESYEFDYEMFCEGCQAPPKKGEKMKKCGPCGFCSECDKSLGGKG